MAHRNHGRPAQAEEHDDEGADPDGHVTGHRVIVIEERGDDLHVSASCKFAVSRLNLPCKQRMVLEKPLQVKEGYVELYVADPFGYFAHIYIYMCVCVCVCVCVWWNDPESCFTRNPVSSNAD